MAMKMLPNTSTWFTKLVKVSFICVLFICGCEKRGIRDFVTVCNDHRILTRETNNALINSIKDDYENMKASGKLKEEDKKVVEDLINRLEVIVQQADVIHRYVISTEVDDKLFVELIQNKFKKSTE